MPFKLSLEIVGARFKSLRKHMQLKQSDVANELDILQNTISRLENGDSLSASIFIQMVNYYSEHFLLHNFLSEHFVIIPNIKHDFYDDVTKKKFMNDLNHLKENIDQQYSEQMIGLLSKFIT